MVALVIVVVFLAWVGFQIWRTWVRPPGPNPVNPDLVAWAKLVDASGLSDKAVADAEWFLRVYPRMAPTSRREVAFRLVAIIGQQVSPPPPLSVAPVDIIETVLAARRKQLGIG